MPNKDSTLGGQNGASNAPASSKSILCFGGRDGNLRYPASQTGEINGRFWSVPIVYVGSKFLSIFK